MGRQKFRLGSWELSKRKNKKTFRCQDSREMFVDFLLCIEYFQLGFELTFFATRTPWGGWGVHDPVAVALQATASPQQLQEDA